MKLISDGRQFLPVDNPQNSLYINEAIKRYLGTTERDEIFFLVGPKGIGKTTLLRQKSHLYRQKPGMKFNANSNELVEYLTASPPSFSKDELLKFKSLDLWERIWRYCLRIIALKTADLTEVSKEVRPLLTNSLRITSLLQNLLSSREEIFKTLEYYEQFLMNDVGKIQSGVAIFIDNVDQAFDRILRNYHHSDNFYKGRNSPTAELWVNAQIGLLSAAYDLNCDLSHIKIFATCRREAFELLPGPLRSNIENYTTKLEYSKTEINEILELKLQEMKVGKVDPKKPYLLEKFLGFKERPHPFIIDTVTKEKRNENPFDYLYRHTFGRPREIVILLQELNDKVISAPNYYKWDIEEKLNRISEVVNLASRDFFDWYQDEIIPHFDKIQLEKFIKLLSTNYIKQEELPRFDPDIIKAYYVFGLIGYTIRRPGQDGLLQKFLPAAKYNYKGFTNLQPSEYYLIHSVMDQSIIDIRGYENHYNPTNIIGNGYPFKEPEVSFEHSKGIDYYYPLKVNANRWKNSNPNYKHHLPLKNYYDNYFSSPNSLNETLEKELDKSFNELTSLHFYTLLGRQFPGEYSEEKQKCLYKLQNELKLKREYQKTLKDSTPGNMLIFQNRIHGRLLFLGCYLLLNMDYDPIHNLFVSGSDNYLNDQILGSKSKLDYFRTSFFIHGLSKNQDLLSKEEIFTHLSSFEKDKIKKWAKEIIPSIINNLNDLKENHKAWVLQSNLFNTDWLSIHMAE
ncbi:MAG: ATP-binding protein [Saprospiraceae bacterium]|nr:ATP-binding protein [Saprospiraceae bacterium]